MHMLKARKTASVRIAASVALVGIVAAALLLRTSPPSVTAETPDSPQILTVDWRTTFVTPSETIDLDKGDRGYGEADVFRLGEAGTGAPVGEFKWTVVATEPPGTPGSLLSGVFRFFDIGDIHVSVVVDEVDGQRVAEGVATGGTGRFGGATGVYSDEVRGGGPRATFVFIQAVPALERATIQSAIRAYMQDNGFAALPASEVNDLAGNFSTNDFSAATGILDLESVGPSGFPFLDEPTTTFFYCWESTGVVTVQDTAAIPDCSRTN